MEKFYKINEVAEILGVDRQTIYKYMKPRTDGKESLPTYDILGSRRIRKDELEKWIEGRREK